MRIPPPWDRRVALGMAAGIAELYSAWPLGSPSCTRHGPWDRRVALGMAPGIAELHSAWPLGSPSCTRHLRPWVIRPCRDQSPHRRATQIIFQISSSMEQSFWCSAKAFTGMGSRPCCSNAAALRGLHHILTLQTTGLRPWLRNVIPCGDSGGNAERS
jgi:hypothetical protein